MSKQSSLPLLQTYKDIVRDRPDLFQVPVGGFEILTSDEEIRDAEKTVEDDLVRNGLHAEWARVGVAFEDQYNLILRDAVRFPDESLGTYYRILMKSGDPCGSAVLPVYGGKIQLLRHYRHATQAWHLEIPRGARADGGGSLVAAARDELFEEMGGVPESLIDLGVLHSSSGLTQESFQLYLGNLSKVGLPNINEGIAEIVSCSLAEFERAIAYGEITDAFTISAFARARLRGLF